MSGIERVVDRVYRIRLGWVNVFAIVAPNELTLIDCGGLGKAKQIDKALRSLGCRLEDVRHLLVTHCHPDHTGSLAAIQSLAADAQTYMSASDGQLTRRGIAIPKNRPLRPAPGFQNAIFYHSLFRVMPRYVEPGRIDCEVFDGQRLDIAGGLTVIATPGHTQGHVSYLWHGENGVLFAGDVAANFWGPTYSVVYEDFEVAQQTLVDLSSHPFDTVCFGHGRSMIRAANRDWSNVFGQAHLPALAASEV